MTIDLFFNLVFAALFGALIGIWIVQRGEEKPKKKVKVKKIPINEQKFCTDFDSLCKYFAELDSRVSVTRTKSVKAFLYRIGYGTSEPHNAFEVEKKFKIKPNDYFDLEGKCITILEQRWNEKYKNVS